MPTKKINKTSMTYCSACGTKNGINSKFCKNCGEEINKTIAEESNKTTTSRDKLNFWDRLFRTRINRKNYLLGGLSLYVFYFLMILLGTSVKFLLWPLIILIIIYGISLQIRRAHDMGKSGTYILWALVPLVNIYISFNLLLGEGEKGNNEHGPQPESKFDLISTLGFK